MADGETREDVVQLTVAALDAAPDAALMRELEAVVDGGGSLLDVAEALVGDERWDELYPSSQTPAEFADAWLGRLLPGADADLLASGRNVVVPLLDDGGAPAGLVLAAQEFLSGPAVPEAFADAARAFLERSGTAMEELTAGETAEDIVQLAVAAYGAAPGASLMADLDAAVDNGGTLRDAAETLVEDERWEALYPSSQTPAEFADAWLENLLPGADADLLTVGRNAVVSHLDAGGAPADLVLLAQGYLGGPGVSGDFAGFADAFLNRSEVAAEHSVVRKLDGSAAELREMLVSVTDDDATVQAAINALDDQMPDDQMPGASGGGTGGASGGTGGASGGTGGASGGTGGASGGTGGASGGGTGGASGGTGGASGGTGDGSGGTGGSGDGNGGTGGSSDGDSGTGGASGNGGGVGVGGGDGQTPNRARRDATDDRGRVVLSEFDENGDDAYDRAEAYEYGPGDLKIRTVWYDEWALKADGKGKALDMQTADRTLTVVDGNGDGTGESRRHDAYGADGETIVESLFDDDNDGGWERAEGYERMGGDGALILKKSGVDVEGVDPETATADYAGGRAEIHILNGDGDTAETRFFDDYDGGSDFAALEAGTPDRVHYFGLDLDGDGGPDGARYDKLDADGRIAESLFDIDGDGTADRAEAYDHDDAGRRTETRFYDAWTGTFDLSGGTADKIHSWTYSAVDTADGRWLTFSEDLDGDGTPDRSISVAYRGDGDGDGAWDHAKGDGARYAYDGRGRTALAEFDTDGDDTYDRAEAYEYGAGDLKIRTVWYDDWALDADGKGKALDMQTADRALTIVDGGGPGGSRRHDAYGADGETIVESLFDDDNAADGSWERAEGYEREGGDGALILKKSGADVKGVDPATATVDYAGGRAEIHILDAAGGTAETRFFDDYDGGSDFAALKARTPDRVHYFGLDLDGDGGSDDARYDKLDADGRVAESLFDIDGDGTADRAEAYDHDAAGRRTETRFYDPYTGTFDLSGAAAGKIHGWTYSAADADDGRWLTFSEDLDGDGAADVKTTATRHGASDAFATRLEEYDDGAGGGTADDGTPDRRVLRTFDEDGEIVSTKYDDNADGAWDRSVDARETRDGGDRVVLIEFDDNGDGIHTRAEAYEYGAGDLKTKITWYDDWAVDAKGAGKPPTDQTINRTLTVADDDKDGTGDSRRHDAYAADGKQILRSLFDDDNDGDWERARGFERDAFDRLVLMKSGTVAGADPDTATVAWDEAEIHILDAGGGTAETRFFDAYDGGSDFAALKAGAPDRVHYFGLDLDGDGGSDDARYDKLDADGRVAESLFDIDGDGTADRAEAYGHDAAGRRTETRFYDAWTGTFDLSGAAAGKIHGWTYSAADTADGRWLTFSEDLDGDGTVDRSTSVTYRGDGDAFAARRVEHDDGSGGGADDDGVVDRITLETFGENGAVESVKYDDDGDGVWDHAKGDGARYAYDGRGRTALAEFDTDGDDTYDRAEAYEYGSGDLKIRTVWYDDWALEADGKGKALDMQTADRALTVVDGDGAGASRRHDAYGADGETIVESLFDDDNDGGWDRAEGYEREGGDGALILKKSGADVRGVDPATATVDYAGGRAEIHILDAAAGTAETRFFDDYDGGSDFAALKAGTPDRVHRFGLELDEDGSDDARYDKLNADGRVIESLLDIDGDGTADRAEAYGYDAAGRRTETRFYDPYMGTFDLSGATAGKIHGWTYSAADAADGRWLTFSEDFDGDGAADLKTTATRHGASDAFATRLDEYDDGSGGGTDDDGTADRRVLRTFDEDGEIVSTKYDDNADETWDRAFDARRTATDDKSRPVLVEFDDDADGTFERAEAYSYSLLGAGKVRTDFYDDWDDSHGVDDLDTLDFFRSAHYGRDYDGDGSADDGKTETFDENGNPVRIEYDYDSNARVERIETLTYGSGDVTALIRLDDGRGTGEGGRIPSDGAVDRLVEEVRAADGKALRARLDDDLDGVWDREQTYILGAARDAVIDAAGRDVEIRHFDGWDGSTDLDDLSPDRVHRYAYEGGGRRWTTVLRNDDPGSDDVFETRVALTRDAAGAVTGRLFEYDDGKGEGANGKTAGDGVFDRRRRDEFDEDGRIVKILHDSDNDGVWNYIDTYRHETWKPDDPRARRAQRTDTMDDDDDANDRQGGVARLVFGTDGDDHRGDLKLIGNRWQHDWFIPGRGDDRVDGGRGAGDAQQGRDIHIFRYGDGVNVVQGFGPEGSSVHDTIWIAEEEFSTADVRVIKNVTLTPTSVQTDHPEIPAHVFPGSGGDDVKVTVLAYGDGTADRIVLEGWDSDDVDYFRERFVAPAAIGYDPHTFAYGSRNEVRERDDKNGDISEIRRYDSWDGVGDASGLADQVTRHIRAYRSDDETLASLLTETNGVDGGSRRHDAYDDDGKLVVRSLFDDDNAPDGGWERAEGLEFDAAGRRVLHKSADAVAGTDPAAVEIAWNRARIHILRVDGGTAETRFFDAYDGSSDFAALSGGISNRIHRFGTDHDGDGTADIRRDALDAAGRVVLSVFESGADENKLWAEAYEYGAGNLKVRTVWHDDWKDGTARADQAVDRALTVLDADADGTGESRQHDEYDAGLIVRTLFDDDNAGAWERAEGYERDASGRIVMEKSGVPDDASDPSAAAVVWSKAEIHILNAEGVKEQTRFFDGYDGTSDFAGLVGENADRVRLDLDGDLGLDDVRFNKLDGEGRIVESLFDLNHDGVDHAERYLYDDAGRKTESRFHDPWTGTFDLSSATADKVHAWTYSASDTSDARWLSFSEDFDGDGKTDRKTEVSRRDDTGVIATRRTSHDDGTGAGTAGDGVFDSRRLDSYDAGGLIESTKWDDGIDGTWNRSLSYSYSRHEDGRVKTRLIEADGGWPFSGILSAGTAADGTADGKQLDAYDAEGLVESSKRDDDNDGTWNRISSYSYHEGGGVKTQLIKFDDAGFPRADDGTIDRARLVAYDAGGRRESVKHDDDNDGVYEKIETYGYHENGAIKTVLTELDDGTGDGDDDGTIDSRTLRSRGADGVVESVKWDGDNDGGYEKTETYSHHENGGIKTLLREFDDGSWGGTADDGTSDRKLLYTYDSDGALASSGWDNDGDGLLDPWFSLRTSLDLDGDGAARDYALDRMNSFGVITESLIRVHRNGRRWETIRAEAYERDDAGRTTEVRIHDPHPGGFGFSGETPDRIHIYTYADDAGDARWLTFSEDFDADGGIDRKSTATYHGDTLKHKTLDVEYDNGENADGSVVDGNIDDGTVDLRILTTYTDQGQEESVKYDYGNDGTYERTVNALSWVTAGTVSTPDGRDAGPESDGAAVSLDAADGAAEPIVIVGVGAGPDASVHRGFPPAPEWGGEWDAY